MLFVVIMLNVLALSGLVALWLSVSFIAIDIYKTNSNVSSAVALAKISNILRLVLVVWFVLLAIAFTKADNLLPLLLYLVLFSGLYFYIHRLYGNLLKNVTSIRKSDNSPSERALIISSVTKYEDKRTKIKKHRDFVNFKKFFWGLNILICTGMLINFWLRDTGGSQLLEVVVASVMMVLLLQILFVPIYWLVKKIVFATLTKN